MSLTIFPTLPGAIVRHQVLKGLNVTQGDLAKAMGVSKVRVNHIINGRAPITVNMALRLARVTNTTPEYWLRLQIEWDLHHAKRRMRREIEKLEPLCASSGDD